jgi:CheY-like chemotaxis protein
MFASQPSAPKADLFAGISPHPMCLVEVDKRRILIVEDNIDSGDSLLTLLNAIGYEANLVRDGETAVQAALSFDPDVILMDVGLPGLSGYEAARRIRARNPHGKVRIAALTGWGQPRDQEKATAAGMDYHLLKPLNLSVLQSILESIELPRVEKRSVGRESNY